MYMFSAPGKVIIHGEHSVVYGKMAIAGALDLRTYLILRCLNDGRVKLTSDDNDLTQDWSVEDITNALSGCQAEKENCPSDDMSAISDTDNIVSAITNLIQSPDDRTFRCLASLSFLYIYCSMALTTKKYPAVDVKVTTQLVVGAGLGSSASFCVCVAAALLQAHGLIPRLQHQGANVVTWSRKDKDIINKWAYKGERIIHGRPSGIDNAVVTHGGAIKFRNGEISPLCKMPQLPILLTSTNVERHTKTLVSNVARRYQSYSPVIEPVMEAMDAISGESWQVLQRMAESPTSHNVDRLQTLIDMNHNLLCCLGVSHPTLNDIVMVTEKYGLHSKLTGAGGGGCAFTLLDPDQSKDEMLELIEELKSRGFHSWETTVGAPGVCQHFITDESQLPCSASTII